MESTKARILALCVSECAPRYFLEDFTKYLSAWSAFQSDRLSTKSDTSPQKGALGKPSFVTKMKDFCGVTSYNGEPGRLDVGRFYYAGSNTKRTRISLIVRAHKNCQGGPHPHQPRSHHNGLEAHLQR